MRIRSLLIVIQAFIAITINAQVTEDLQLAINTSRTDIPLQYPAFVKEFYQINQYNYVWLKNNDNTQILLQLLQSAPDLGLNEEDYP